MLGFSLGIPIAMVYMGKYTWEGIHRFIYVSNMVINDLWGNRGAGAMYMIRDLLCFTVVIYQGPHFTNMV